MSDPSTIYFPLRSNASALFAGPGVAGVRRRILAAALLSDQVVVEDGIHVAWAGPEGASTMTWHGESADHWQTPHQRGRATGSRHYVAVRSSAAPETAAFHPVVSTDATFSWRATFEPFKRELPASAAMWLSFGHVTDDERVKQIVRDWESSDRLRAVDLRPRSTTPGGPFVRDAILGAGYYDLAVASTAASAVSFDRRHSLAVETRVRAGDAQPIGGHYALEFLLPTEFTWSDVPDLRKHRALRDYRAIVREIEAEALRTSRSVAEINDQIRREYERRLAAAADSGVSFTGRVTLTAVGFILGVVADSVAPIVGGAVVAASSLAASEGLTRAIRPRWLAVDRRLRGRRNGL